jgi:hypothetical protein
MACSSAAVSVDVKTLHAKTDAPTLKNGFSEGALTEIGSPFQLTTPSAPTPA